MQLILTRSEHGLFWRSYVLSAQIDADRTDQAIIFRHRLDRRCIYLSPQAISLAARADAAHQQVRKLSIWKDAGARARRDLAAAILELRAATAFTVTIGQLLTGLRLRCADLDETIAAERALIEALDALRLNVDNARAFETRREQMFEPDRANEPTMAHPATWARQHR